MGCEITTESFAVWEMDRSEEDERERERGVGVGAGTKKAT